MDTFKVLSIDIGIVNLGYVYSEITFDQVPQTSKYKNLLNNQKHNTELTKKNINIVDCNRIDITKMKHNRVQRCDCKLHHECCIPDYLDHFIQEHSGYFTNCDLLILERQPPVGITNVQDLLFTKFRDKVLLVSPNSVHKYFGLDSNYDTRKIESETIATEYLGNKGNYLLNHRKHDISDALLMILYFYKIKLDSIINKTQFTSGALDFEQFRFKL